MINDEINYLDYLQLKAGFFKKRIDLVANMVT